ncbi:MAG: hypothetical protein ACXADO_01740 [Candidatus Thorarchaeota archaeon]|jgi:ssDNA-binding replication factor A large subunit
MKLSEVEVGKNVSEIIVRIVSIAPPRIVQTRGGRKTQLTEVLVADEDGDTAIMSLWGFGEGRDLSVGMVIKLLDGWAKDWRGKMQLSLGRSGRIEEVEDDGTIPSISELRKRSSSLSPDK